MAHHRACLDRGNAPRALGVSWYVYSEYPRVAALCYDEERNRRGEVSGPEPFVCRPRILLRRVITLRVLVALWLLLATAATSLAQEQPPGKGGAPPATTLTLRDALERANRQNLDLAAARLRRSISQAGIRVAGQLPNPTLNFTALRDTPHEGLFFDLPVEIGGKRGRRIELARQGDFLTVVEIDSLARQIRRRVRAAYYAVTHTQTFTAQKQRALELARRVDEIAKARFDAGEVAQLEPLRADLEVALAETELAVAKQREKVALSGLNLLLNEPMETAWELSPIEELPPAVILADLVIRAQASNPELQHLAQEQKIEQSHRSLLAAERIPTVGLQFGADFNSPGQGGFRAGPRGQISFALPIFSRNQGELAQSRATSSMLDSEVAATRRAVAGRVEAGYYEWSTRETEVDLYRRTLLPAVQRFEGLAEESYRAGRATLLTVLDAQRNVQQIEREYLDSLLALQTAFADLEEIVGTPLD
jgi:cobalt-zinc-cadmium efflux system outer membrane protein